MKKLKNKIEDLGLNYNKEIALLLGASLSIIILSVITYLYFKNIKLVIIGIALLFAFIISYFYRYSLIEDKNKRKLLKNFIDYFSFFRIYIFNGDSVYTALNKTTDYASKEIKQNIDYLIEEINQDKTINPFIKFANKFKSKLIEDVMISIYQMIENGNNTNYINQFITIFENLKKRINSEEEFKRNERFNTLVNTALVGSALIMIILVFGIVNLIGEI